MLFKIKFSRMHCVSKVTETLHVTGKLHLQSLVESELD